MSDKKYAVEIALIWAEVDGDRSGKMGFTQDVCSREERSKMQRALSATIAQWDDMNLVEHGLKPIELPDPCK